MNQSVPPPGEKASVWRALFGHGVAMVVSLAVTVTVLILILVFPFHGDRPAARQESEPDTARLVGPRTIAVQADSLLAKKLSTVPVALDNISAPVLTVTGSIVARLAPGKDPVETRWDFSTPEVATAYADWLKARADVPFSETQLTKVRDLHTAKVAAQVKLVDRMKRLVKSGTDTEKDLAAAEADLRQAEIQGEREVHDAENALKTAIRSRGTLERQLQLAGVDPHLLGRSSDGTVIVVADVPEARVGLVLEGQSCTARLFAFPNVVFTGKVGSVGSSLSKERRTLRVFFQLDDPMQRLKPGMFAVIGLGTDTREVVYVPEDAVLHVGRSDYVLVGTADGKWDISEVKVGDAHGSQVEILSGVQAGDKVVGAGAILLQPLVVKAVHSER